jgi:hypothetical protein
MRSKIETVVRWVSMIMGILILGSCTIAGTMMGAAEGAVVGLLLGVVFVGCMFGWVYAYFLLRRDLESIRAEIAKLDSR